jgi:hypothetical protein
VAAIDHHLEAVQRDVVGGVLGELDVAAARVVDPVGLADLARRQRRGLGFLAEDVALDEISRFIGQLVAVRAEDFHAVVLVGIVGGGDHDPGRGTHRFGEVGDRGVGSGPTMKTSMPIETSRWSARFPACSRKSGCPCRPARGCGSGRTSAARWPPPCPCAGRLRR